ncbi:hypothetical protein LUZ60_005349 [Juncus effusus]|nr:hypothetical protein LUZ60_005349 [Juncus effusus]
MRKTDVISSLPNCLIHHILSFLTTKQTVLTTVLSKRWFNVWKSVPRLDLDSSDFNQVESFVNFANSILHHKLFPNPEQLDMFNLMWNNCNESNYETIKTWILNLVSLKPKVVNIDINKSEEMSFFSYLFDCSTLEILFLWTENDAGWTSINPTVVNLPCLKVLQFGYVYFNNEFIQKIMIGCPIIEELVIENSLLDVTEKIRSSSLRTLIIMNNEYNKDAILRISIPSLVDLDCEVPLGQISFENLESLEFASVTLHNIEGDYDGKEVKLLRGLSNAKTIEFWGIHVNDMLETESSDLPVFEKLESLDLGGFSVNKNLEPLASFLKRTSNLNNLALRHVTMEKHHVFQRRRFVEIQCERLKPLKLCVGRAIKQ